MALCSALSKALARSKVAAKVDLNCWYWLRRRASSSTLLSLQLSIPARKALCWSSISILASIRCASILWRTLAKTQEMEIGLNSPDREAWDFVGMKIVLEIARCFGSFSHQRMRLKIQAMISSGMARNWWAVRPSGPGEMAREGLAARISSVLIELAMESWTGCCVHSGMVMVAGCVNSVVQ